MGMTLFKKHLILSMNPPNQILSALPSNKVGDCFFLSREFYERIGEFRFHRALYFSRTRSKNVSLRCVSVPEYGRHEGGRT